MSKRKIKEKWVCKICKKPIELWGRGGFTSTCNHIELGDNLDNVGIKIKQASERKG